MQVKKSQYVEVTLIMTLEEAIWIKTLIQNPIGPNPTEDEERMRKSIWDALNREGIPSL